MPPSVFLTLSATPAEPSRPSPMPVHFLDGSVVQAVGAAVFRYFSKFSVVPDSPVRKKTLIAVAGSAVPLLIVAMAGSFHMVILPLKMLAMTSGVSTSLSTPLTLNGTEIGPVTIGLFQAGEPQVLSAASCCTTPSTASVFSAESEPAQSTWPAMNCLMPVPEPVGL